MINLLIVDADGVLVNIKAANAITWGIVLPSMGFFDPLLGKMLAVRDPMHCSVEKYAASMAEVADDTEGAEKIAEVMLKLWNSLYPQIYAKEPLIPGVEEFLKDLSDNKQSLKVAVATNTPSEMILPKLEPLKRYLDEIVIADRDGHRKKPNPAMINYLLNKFGLNPDQAILIGDGPNDAGAAEQAGILYHEVPGWPGKPKDSYKAIRFDDIIAAYKATL